MTGPWCLLKPVLHAVRSSASSFKLQYPLLSIRSSSNCLPLLPHLTVISILPSSFTSINCFGRQFLRKMWPIPVAIFPFIVYRDIKIMRKWAVLSISAQLLMIGTQYAYNHVSFSCDPKWSWPGGAFGVCCIGQSLTHWGRGHLNCLNARSRGF